MSVPALRFKDNGQEFPEWEEKTLGDVCICLDNQRKPLNGAERQTMQGEFPYWGANNIMDYVDDYLFDETIVLLAEDGGNFNEYKTRPIANISHGKCWVNNHTHVLKGEIGLSNEFLFYSLVHKNITGYVSGGTRAKLTKGEMLKIEISIPNPAEQTKIANILTAVDQKISLLTQKADLLSQYKKGVMQQIFSQELRFKDDDGQEFPEWEEKTLGEIAEINPKTDILPEEFIYIDLESVEKGILLKETMIRIDNAPSRAQRYLKKEDILFQMVRPYQGNNLFFHLTGNYVASTGYSQIRTLENPRFLYQYLHLESFTAEVMNRCTGTSYPAINSSGLAKILVTIPSLPEQTKIANFLSAIDEKITINQTQLNTVKQYKQGLLQQMFV